MWVSSKATMWCAYLDNSWLWQCGACHPTWPLCSHRIAVQLNILAFDTLKVLTQTSLLYSHLNCPNCLADDIWNRSHVHWSVGAWNKVVLFFFSQRKSLTDNVNCTHFASYQTLRARQFQHLAMSLNIGFSVLLYLVAKSSLNGSAESNPRRNLLHLLHTPLCFYHIVKANALRAVSPRLAGPWWPPEKTDGWVEILQLSSHQTLEKDFYAKHGLQRKSRFYTAVKLPNVIRAGFVVIYLPVFWTETCSA